MAGAATARNARSTRSAETTAGQGARRTTKRSRRASRRVPPPLEHRILMTATLCLLAFGP